MRRRAAGGPGVRERRRLHRGYAPQPRRSGGGTGRPHRRGRQQRRSAPARRSRDRGHRPRRRHAAAGFPRLAHPHPDRRRDEGRLRPPAPRDAGGGARAPCRMRGAGGLRAGALGARRRLVRMALARRQSDEGGTRRGLPGPARLPGLELRTRGLGEQPRARAGGDRSDDARPAGWRDRARCRGATERDAARRGNDAGGNPPAGTHGRAADGIGARRNRAGPQRRDHRRHRAGPRRSADRARRRPRRRGRAHAAHARLALADRLAARHLRRRGLRVSRAAGAGGGRTST